MTDARALRERVAKDRYEEKRKRLLEAFGDTAGWPEWESLRQALKDIEIETYTPVIDLVLEEAARCAEDYEGKGMEIDYIRQSGDASRTRSDIAIAIRALKSGACTDAGSLDTTS